MIFCGDFVYPVKHKLNYNLESDSDFFKGPKFINFESSVNLSNEKITTKGIALRSLPSSIEFLHRINVKGVSLANNHFFDYDFNLSNQINFFKKNKIVPIGAGDNIYNASKPFYFEEENLIVISFGWNVIRCQYASHTEAGVNPYEYTWVERQIKQYRNEFPSATLVACFHWNYEFEQFPQPADREFSHFLIDLGVDAIIGHHAHIIQGFEYYKDKPIFYGLGNFYFPNGNYEGFDIYFPDKAKKGLSVEINKSTCKTYVTELSDNRQLHVVAQGPPDSIDELTAVSTFQNLTHNEYIEFFKYNREKTKALPIYRSYKHKIRNEFFDKFVMYRQIPVDLISKFRGQR